MLFAHAGAVRRGNRALVEVTGRRRLHYRATTAVYDQGHSTWHQVQRAGGPNTTTFWDFTDGSAKVNINVAYGAWVADTILPNVIPFIPGTNALWDPWQGSHNGKGLREDAFDNATRMVLNQDFTAGLTQPSPLLDYFPYVSPPPTR